MMSGVDAPGFDLRAVRIETAAGRKEYQALQASVARCAAPLRQQLLRYYDTALETASEAVADAERAEATTRG